MARTCQVCGREYEPGSLQLDSGTCEGCSPPRLNWVWPSGPGTTRTIYRYVLLFHALYLFLSSIILCEMSTVGGLYSLTVIGYCLTRMVIGQVRGYPALTHRQEFVLLSLPAWGPVLTGAMVALLEVAFQAAGIMPYLARR